MRTIVFAGKAISEDDVRQVLEEVALEQEIVMGTIAQELLERGERSGLEVALLQTIGDAIELADTPDQVRAIYWGG